MNTKPVIRVLIPLGKTPLTNKLQTGDGYEGVLYDIWKEVKKRLKDKYSFHETFTKNNNFTELAKKVYYNEYDIIIAHYQPTQKRDKYLFFTSTILLSKNTILHFPRTSQISMINVVFKDIIVPLIVVLIMGICFGVLLYFISPMRYKIAKLPKSAGFRRTLLTVVASFVGERGKLSENSTLSVKDIMSTFSILLISFFVVLYIQAIITNKVISYNKHKEYNTKNIEGKLLLSPEGYYVGKSLERHGVVVEYHKKNIEQLVELYKENKNKYIGIALDLHDATSYEEPEIELMASRSDFGFKEICWGINKQKFEFLSNVNKTLIDVQHNLIPYRVCKKYIKEENSFLCNI